MTLAESFSLFAILLLLAAIPGASVVLVVSRSLTEGLANGVAVAFGIVCADVLFVLFAISGLTLIANSIGGWFLFIKLLAAVYLCWLGMGLLFSTQSSNEHLEAPTFSATVSGSFAAGFLLTLGDAKAILFYASLLPAFIHVESPGWSLTLNLITLVVIAVGSVKVAYAMLAQRLGQRLATGTGFLWLQKLSGLSMLGVTLFLLHSLWSQL